MITFLLIVVGSAFLEGVYLGMQDRFGPNISEGLRRYRAGLE